MDRITGTAIADLGDGKRGFQDEILATGGGSQEGTVVTAQWLNAVQEELLKVIEDAGIPPDEADLTQLSQAIDQKVIAPFVANQSLVVPGWSELPGGKIEQWGTLTLPAVGNFHAEVISGVTWYTMYYQVPFPITYPITQFTTVVSLAATNFSQQSSHGFAHVYSNRGDVSPTDPSIKRSGFDVAVASRVLGYVPTIHWYSIGK